MVYESRRTILSNEENKISTEGDNTTDSKTKITKNEKFNTSEFVNKETVHQ